MTGGDLAYEWMARGAHALRQGNLVAAEQAFAEAASLAPTLADAWFNLGWVQRAQRRFEDALRSYDGALAAGVDGAEEVYVNQAAILADHLFRTEEAAAAYQRALTACPEFGPALSGLAQLHEDEGRADEARSCYRRLLAGRPGDGRALGRIALIDLRSRDPGEVASELGSALAAARAAEDRAELLFALASALDAVGDYAKAFATVTEANLIAEQLGGQRYDRTWFERLVDRLIATFREPLPPVPRNDAAPLFLCGAFRSGSTLAEQILARHPAIRAGGELEAIPAIAAALQPYPEVVPRMAAPQLEQLRAAYHSETARLPGSGGRLTDKRCDNILHLGLIQALFPGVPIVHTTRHPLDILVSTLFLRFGEGLTYGHRWEDAVHHAIHQERLVRHWRGIMPGRIHDLDYDRLVTEPETALRSVLSFLGLPWDERLLRPEVAGTVRTASNWQVRQPLHQRSSGRWRHYARELGPARQMFEAAGIALSD